MDIIIIIVIIIAASTNILICAEIECILFLYRPKCKGTILTVFLKV